MMHATDLSPDQYTGLYYDRGRPLAEKIARREGGRTTAQEILDDAVLLLLWEAQRTCPSPVPPSEALCEAVLHLRLRDPVAYQRRKHAARPQLSLFEDLPPHTD